MPWIETDTIEKKVLNPDMTSWVYNGLDCAVTFELYEVLREQLLTEPAEVQTTYANTLDKLAPVMEMGLRGVKIDLVKRDLAVKQMTEDLAILESHFNHICQEVFGVTFKWTSPLQLKNLFYDILRAKPIRKRNTKGILAPTLNREALEKIQTNPNCAAFCNILLKMRDIQKSVGFFRTEIDPDGAMRCNFNLAGTDTGRLSSSFSEFGTGTNLQNVDRRLRYAFVARRRKVFVNVDLEQADSRNVAARIYKIFYESHGEAEAAKYLNACESGDLHTTVCRMAFTKLDWPDDDSLHRAIADQKAYRDYSYRDLSKKLGHGTNYYGQPETMAIHTKTETSIIQTFQNAYFGAFPLIPEWHKWVINQLKTTASLYNLWGRRRFFHDRADAASTIRAAIAYDPQSSTAEEIDRAYQYIWKHHPYCDLLVQVHDSICFEMDYDKVNTHLPTILANMPARLTLPGDRDFFVPLEAKVGWNWADAVKEKDGTTTNPLGLVKFKGAETRVPPAWMK